MTGATAALAGFKPTKRKERIVASAPKNEGKPFGAALRDLLVGNEEFETLTGNINWRAVAGKLDSVHYETLRKAVTGDRPANANLIEQVAKLTGVTPDYFAEYQLAQAQRAFDPKEVGFEQALTNLHAWSDFQKKRRSR